ncbi:hypothetical protein KI387_028875, partial [Taxus chinensis]
YLVARDEVGGGQQKLVGWKNSLDPAPGPFSFQMDPSGAEQFVLLEQFCAVLGKWSLGR